SSVQSVEGPSGADEAMRLRPYVVSHDPPSSLGVEVVSSSSGGATSVDSIVLKALMIMQSCYNSDSIMMIRRLAEVWERFCIPTEYELHVPLPGQRPYDSFKLSIDALEVIKDMTEAWLVEAGLNPAPRGTSHFVDFLIYSTLVR
ncbi:hypothetical protein GW17_00055425, partial [Ensete ventricosum]